MFELHLVTIGVVLVIAGVLTLRLPSRALDERDLR
jgi:hypothetical protein